MFRALVIQDAKGKFKDLEDVVKIARALGQQCFKTHAHVRVLRIYGPDPEFGYVAVVEGSEKLVVSKGKRVRNE